MAVREDCRHYVMQTVRGGERLEHCKLGVSDLVPFACPEGCVFFEKRSTSSAGWSVSREGREPRPNP
jgi:hypothetical protein